MRGLRLLTVMLTAQLAVAGAVTAQPSQTDNKPFTKQKAGGTEPEIKSGSALDRARAVQSGESNQTDAEPATSAEGATPDESTPVDEGDADEPRLPLAVKLFLTHDPAGFTKAWQAGEESLPTTTTISTANPVMAMVAVSGCTRGKDGKCAIILTSRTAGPDGQFDKPRAGPPWKTAPMRGKPELAPASFGLRLGPGDPAGRYTVEVTVDDVVAGTKRVVTAMVTKPAAVEGR